MLVFVVSVVIVSFVVHVTCSAHTRKYSYSGSDVGVSNVSKYWLCNIMQIHAMRRCNYTWKLFGRYHYWQLPVEILFIGRSQSHWMITVRHHTQRHYPKALYTIKICEQNLTLQSKLRNMHFPGLYFLQCYISTKTERNHLRKIYIVNITEHLQCELFI